ncbi:unnamed protein product [Effrenium voratum]|nr:unnamed protein product [Effrenium voratum]
MRNFLTEKGFAVKQVDNTVAFVIVPSSEQNQADDPNEPSEPSEHGSGDEGEKDVDRIMVEVEYLNVFHVFTIYNAEMKVLDMKFVLHGWLGVPWFQMELHHWTDILDDDDRFLNYMPEEDNKGVFTQVQLIVNEDGGMTDSMEVVLVEQFGERRRHTLEMAKLLPFQTFMSFLGYFMSGQLDIDPSDLTLFCHSEDTLEDYSDKMVVNVHIRGQGGVFNPVKKTYLKREPAIAKLKEDTQKQFDIDPEADTPDADLPVEFVQFLDKEREKLNSMMALKMRMGSSFFKAGIKHAQLVKDLAGMFCEENYNYSEQNGEANIDPTNFINHVKSEVERRSEGQSVVDDATVGANCLLQ